MEEQKGIKELIDVVNLLSDNENYYFHIVGKGSLEQKVKNEIKNDNVSYYDKIYGLSSYLSSFDYVFMPSHFEGLAILPIEASLAGIPAIINDCAGLGETLPNDWPLKVHDNEIEQYMQIFKIKLPTFDTIKYGNVAKKFAQQHFGIEQMQVAYENFYEA
jgi:glycosyltransferase involved in cell wall biosynthesis